MNEQIMKKLFSGIHELVPNSPKLTQNAPKCIVLICYQLLNLFL